MKKINLSKCITTLRRKKEFLYAIALIIGSMPAVNSESVLAQKGYDYNSVTQAPKAFVANIAERVTVKIIGAGSSGSGVIIGKNEGEYIVATAWHVLANNGKQEEIGIMTPDGITHTTYGSYTKRIGGVDLGTVRFSSNNEYKIAKLSTDLSELNRNYTSLNTEGQGPPLAVGGYKQGSRALTYSIGILAAYADVGIDSGYQLFYTNNTFSGMSGGPILNYEGDLIGIHGRGERDQVAIERYGRPRNSKTAINQGIPISYLRKDIINRPLQVKDTKEYLDKAMTLSRYWGREQIALEMTNKIIQLSPTPAAYYARGFINNELFRTESAIKDFREAVTLNPNEPELKYHLADALGKSGNLEEARKLTEGLLKEQLSPRLEKMTLITNSQINAREGNSSEAVSAAKRAIKLDRSDALSYIVLTDALSNEAAFEEILLSTESYQGSPSAEIYAIKANAHFMLGNLRSAWENINQAIVMHEMFGNTASNARLSYPETKYLLRSKLNALQGKCSDATKDIGTATKINANNPTINHTKQTINRICSS